jgi:hypothetical protein
MLQFIRNHKGWFQTIVSAAVGGGISLLVAWLFWSPPPPEPPRPQVIARVTAYPFVFPDQVDKLIEKSRDIRHYASAPLHVWLVYIHNGGSAVANDIQVQFPDVLWGACIWGEEGERKVEDNKMVRAGKLQAGREMFLLAWCIRDIRPSSYRKPTVR